MTTRYDAPPDSAEEYYEPDNGAGFAAAGRASAHHPHGTAARPTTGVRQTSGVKMIELSTQRRSRRPSDLTCRETGGL
jgi:hypothetical protein